MPKSREASLSPSRERSEALKVNPVSLVPGDSLMTHAVMTFKREIFSYMDDKFASLESRLTGIEDRLNQWQPQLKREAPSKESLGISETRNELEADMRQLLKQLREL